MPVPPPGHTGETVSPHSWNLVFTLSTPSFSRGWRGAGLLRNSSGIPLTSLLSVTCPLGVGWGTFLLLTLHLPESLQGGMRERGVEIEDRGEPELLQAGKEESYGQPLSEIVF